MMNDTTTNAEDNSVLIQAIIGCELRTIMSCGLGKPIPKELVPPYCHRDEHVLVQQLSGK